VSEPLSADAVYVRVEKPRGILRWDLDVAANAVGDAAKTVRYGYRLEHDRNLELALPGDGGQKQELRQEFEQLNKARAKR
jgi:hypothetical protein